MGDRTLIVGGQIVSMDLQIGTLTGDLLIDGGVITAVGEVDPAAAEGAEIIDASRKIVMPGFVDAHRHTWQSALRHRNADRYGLEYFQDVMFSIGPRCTPDDVYVGTLLGALAAIDCGTTTMFDWAHIQNSPAHADASVRALKESGLRAVFGHGWSMVDPVAWNANSSIPHSSDIKRIQAEHFAEPGLVTLAMSARGPEQTDDATWRKDLELARSLGIQTSMHVGIAELGPLHRAVSRMHDAGELGEDLVFIHLNSCSDEELAHIAEAGASVCLGVQVEMTSQGSGAIPIDRMLAAGLIPSLSGDTETMGAGDMFTQVRMALAEYRLKAGTGQNAAGSPETLSAIEALNMGTQAGADALGLGSVCGSLAPGKAADVVLLDAWANNLAPVSDPVGSIVLGAHPGNVDTVLIGGSVVKRDRQLVGVDMERLIAEATASNRRLVGGAV
jgi:5-methylthioadenosine/S-adenosylhomocysteine deaminase